MCKMEAVLWFTEFSTITCIFLYLIPVLGNEPYPFYYISLVISTATSVLMMCRRSPRLQFSMQYLKTLFLDDSSHYILFSLIFISSHPITMVILPVFLRAVTGFLHYTEYLAQRLGSRAVGFVRTVSQLQHKHKMSVQRFVACTEIFILPVVIVTTFVGKAFIFLPLLYYVFLCLRYTSRKNPSSRTVFTEMKVVILYLSESPHCPRLVRGLFNKSMGLISHLAPPIAGK